METPASTITSTGDLGGQKVAMSIDSSAMAHIMSILTDLYSDPEMAVIREYSTNALDAHVQAGNTAPIEIHTPNGMSPYFKVIDHGVGLSVDDITNMYSQYGASTKRNTNDQVGMLGLGAKSALTLVPQFNLTSVKNGVRILVSISRDATGAGQMEIVDTRCTDEPNGVEISIPIPRSHTFADKCKNFFRFWKEGAVLVDGKAPAHITGRPVGDNFIINSSLDSDFVVMGNVAYPVKDKIWTHSYHPLGVVAFVNIGDVNFTPSREALHYTPQTEATLARLRQEFADGLTASIQKDVDDSESYTEAWRKVKEWKSNFGGRVGEITYKGVIVPSDIPFASIQTVGSYNNTYAKQIEGKEFSLGYSRGRSHTTYRSVNPNMIDGFLFITGFADSLKMSPVQREKAAVYVQENKLKATKVIIFNRPEFITNQDHLKFLDGINIVPWADIAKIKIARTTTATGTRIVRTDPYDLFTGGYTSKQVSTLDTSKAILYYSTTELNQPDWLISMFPDAQIVILTKNRWDKFQRDFPTAQHYQTAVVAEQKVLVDKLTESDKILWHYSSSRYTVRDLDWQLIDDPDLALFVKTLNGGKLSDAALNLQNTQRRYGNTEIECPSNPLTKYPLAANINRTGAEHAHWYLNSFYSHLNNKEN